MIYFLQQLLNGLATGAIYASLGLALVLIYRTTNIANFAQGEMATFSAFLTWQLTEFGVPIGWAILISIGLSLIMGAVTYVLIVRPVQYKDEMTIIIVTLGLFLAYNSATGAIWGFMQKASPSPLPDQTWTLGTLRIGAELLAIVAVLMAISVGHFISTPPSSVGKAWTGRFSTAPPDSIPLILEHHP